MNSENNDHNINHPDPLPVLSALNDPVRLAAVGDLLLVKDPRGKVEPRDYEQVLAGVKSILTPCDIVLGNLECTLDAGVGTVPTEPRVIATEQMVRQIRAAGINVVTLANNHTFDGMREGFHRLRELLDELGIAHFGAADNRAEAEAPAVLEVRGTRLAFIGAVDDRTGVSDAAGLNRAGIATLDEDRMTEQLRRLSAEFDHVIVSLHWGEERVNIPSPSQVRLARALVEAGASLVVGHHPHVLQGMESYGTGAIVYSLGNFIASEVLFTSGDAVTWNRTERTGCILRAELERKKILKLEQIPTYDSGKAVEIDQTGFGSKRITRLNRAVRRGITLRRYRWEHFRVKTLKPILGYLE